MGAGHVGHSPESALYTHAPLTLPGLDLDELWDLEEAQGNRILRRFASAMQEALPAGAEVQAHPGYEEHEITATWSAGPSILQLVQALSHALERPAEKNQRSYGDGYVKEEHEWEGLTLRVVRRLPAKAYGYAWLATGLAGACAGCGSTNFNGVQAQHLARPAPGELDSHPNLLVLTQLGTPRQQIEEYAETLGVLLPQRPHEGGREFHKRGHLEGLLAILDTLR